MQLMEENELAIDRHVLGKVGGICMSLELCLEIEAATACLVNPRAFGASEFVLCIVG